MNPASASPSKSQDSPSRLQVVGIGASAGGLESLEQFFAKYVSLNSFTQTIITTQQRTEIMRWPIQMGRRQML